AHRALVGTLPHRPLGVLGEARDALPTRAARARHRHDIDLPGQTILGPAFRQEINPVPALDQAPAQVRDVSLGATPRRVDSLKSEGQVHGSNLSRVSTISPQPAIIVLSHGGRARLDRFATAKPRSLPRISVMPRVTSRPEADEPCLPPRPAGLGDPSITPPEPAAVAVVDPGHAVGREEELSQVFATPPSEAAGVSAQAVQVDQDDPRDTASALEAFDIQEEVAEVQVLVKEAGLVQSGGDPGQFGDQSALQPGEGATV